MISLFISAVISDGGDFYFAQKPYIKFVQDAH